MWLFPALAAPLVMALALQAQRRVGPEAAGLVGALPMTTPVAVLAVALSLGDRAASPFAMTAAAHVSAQVIFGIAFAGLMRRHGPAGAVVGGVAAFAAASGLLALASPVVDVALAIPALLVGPRVLARGRGGEAQSVEAPRPGLALTCSAGTAVVASVLGVVHVAGPAAGGLFAALPALSATLAVAVARAGGRAAGASAITGMVRGLPSYFAFTLAVALLAARIGAPASVAVGLVLSLGVAWLAWPRGGHEAGQASPGGPIVPLARRVARRGGIAS